MKIGLITFHDTNNFGSYLQTYALYKKVIDLGYDCEIIDYKCDAILKREQFGTFEPIKSPKGLVKDILVNRVLRKKYKRLMTWLTLNATISRKYDKNNIYSSSKNYDTFLVGSDIVWGMDIIENDMTFFLNFEKESIKKRAFSSSIGNPWSEDDKAKVKPLLNEFSSIAVREDDAADWIEELTNKRPNVVCDPTMLLSSEEWAIHKSDKYANKNFVLIYFPTPDNIKDAQAYSRKHGLKCYVINYGLPIKGCKSIKPTSMEDFLSLLYYAEFVFTGSYHGMLFSIYFNKQFAYYNRAHKSRMNNLARKLQVQDREGLVYPPNSMSPIKYSIVDDAVESFRKYSVEVLNAMLAR